MKMGPNLTGFLGASSVSVRPLRDSVFQQHFSEVARALKPHVVGTNAQRPSGTSLILRHKKGDQYAVKEHSTMKL